MGISILFAINWLKNTENLKNKRFLRGPLGHFEFNVKFKDDKGSGVEKSEANLFSST